MAPRTTGAGCFAEGPQAFGKASQTLGKAFAERSSRQSGLGENPIGKATFAESRLSSSRQRLC
jgi:hypothetical protein